MVLDHDSGIVQWAFRYDDKIPERTSLCAIFWRSVIGTPMLMALRALYVIVAFALVVVALFAAFDWCIRNWPTTLKVLTVLAGATAIAAISWILLVGLPRFLRWFFRNRSNPVAAVQQTILYQGAVAVKSKVCPLVEIRRES